MFIKKYKLKHKVKLKKIIHLIQMEQFKYLKVGWLLLKLVHMQVHMVHLQWEDLVLMELNQALKIHMQVNHL